MRAVWAALPAALLVLAGCGLKEVDSEQIARAIQKDIGERAGVPGTKVSCPKNKSADEGTTFDCDVVQPGGQKLKVKVRMRSHGHFTYGAPR